jgi:sucrose-6-phosphate hydrolase SacC (GH32 family)
LLVALTLLAGFVGSPAKAADMQYHESFRPQFHFTAAKNWLNDPNGLVYYEGVYHLFFQYNPYGIESAHKSWGHAVSVDMLHWTQRDVALWPDQLGDIWSGSGVVDVENTSGFQTSTGGDAKGPIVLIYTAAGGVSKESQGRKFTQCLAFSSDGGQTWTKYDKNPVLDNVRGGNRDPKVIWHAPSKRWIMALYLDKSDFALFASPDLKRWEHLQDLTASGMAECPDFFEMPIEEEPGKTAWIFTAANAKYLVGQFDGKQFQPDGGGGVGGFTPLQSEFNPSFYAGQTFSNLPDARRIQIAWLRDGKYPGMPFNQQLSFPTVLTLHRTPDGLRLHRRPIDQIQSLHDRKVTRSNVSLSNRVDELKELAGDLLDLNAVLEVGSAKRVGLRVSGQSIVFDAQAKTLTSLSRAAPLTPFDGRITLRVLVDRTSIEVFANGGAVSLSGCCLPDQNMPTIAPAFFAEDGTAGLISCEGYTLKSAWDSVWPDGLEKRK